MRNNSRIAAPAPIGSTLVSSRAQITIRTAPSIAITTSNKIRTTPEAASTAKEHRMTSTSGTQYQQHHQHHRQYQHYNNAVLVLLPLLLMMLDETSALPPIIKIGKFSFNNGFDEKAKKKKEEASRPHEHQYRVNAAHLCN